MILCLDYGARYIGIAITDFDHRFALRHSVIDQKQKDALATLQEIVTKERIDTILVGVPVSLSGNESAQTKVSRNFMQRLQQVFTALAIKPVDETLTSFEADRRIKDEGGNTHDAHAEAARIMLEDYLAQVRRE